MSFDVKITTKRSLWDLLCPYKCRGCGILGDVVCECCKNYMLQQCKQEICPFCGKRTVECEGCESDFEHVFVGGTREGLLEDLISEYKYQSVRAISEVLVELMDKAIDIKTNDIIIVPLPTIGKHVRARGFDHTLLLAKKLAVRRDWQYQTILKRVTNTVQVGTKAKDRLAQASKTYAIRGKVRCDAKYLLLDDVWTTGASMLSAAKVLKVAGAKKVYGAVLATSVKNVCK